MLSHDLSAVALLVCVALASSIPYAQNTGASGYTFDTTDTGIESRMRRIRRPLRFRAIGPKCGLKIAEGNEAEDERVNVFGEHVNIWELSHALRPDMPLYPMPGMSFRITPLNRGFEKGVDENGTEEHFWLYMNKVETPEHSGTHVDAPIHFAEGKWSVDQIPIRRLAGPAVLLDVEDRVRQSVQNGQLDYRVSVADVRRWETRHGHLPDNVILLVHTGWWRRWNSTAEYLGIPKALPAGERPTDCHQCHFPGFDPQLIAWLLAERPTFSAVGIDTLSQDCGSSQTFRAHRLNAQSNKYGIENLNFESMSNRVRRSLAESGAPLFVQVAPAHVASGSGAPTRVFLFARSQ